MHDIPTNKKQHSQSETQLDYTRNKKERRKTNSMALHKIKDFYDSYHDQNSQEDIRGFDLYAEDDKVGSVDDLLVDDDGRFRYLVVNTGLWIFGKKVLLPIGRSRIDHDARRVYAINFTKDQVEALPEFSNDKVVDFDYEERVRQVYRPSTSAVPTASGTGYAGYETAPPPPPMLLPPMEQATQAMRRLLPLP